MNPSDTSKAVVFSEKVFQRLLAAYPEKHREEYGAAMAQLFRDQCRDAWSESRGWGLTKLWLRVLPDVVGTSFLEHLEAIKERKFMLNRIGSLFRSAPSVKFLSVFTAVFLLAVITAAVIAFILPKTYGSEVVLVFRRTQDAAAKPGIIESLTHTDVHDIVQFEFEIIQSDAVLNEVIEKLDLNAKWGRKLSGGAAIQSSEALRLLRKMIVLEAAYRSPAMHVTVYSAEPDEAVRIATELLRAYFAEHRKVHLIELEEQLSHVNIVQQPSPPFANPNKSRIIQWGIFLGFVLGLLAGGSAAGISFWRHQSAPPKIVA